jgi:hypothetical protein
VLAALALPSNAAAQSATGACDGLSPIALPCVAVGKVVDAVAAECRRAGVPDRRCTLPLAHEVTQAARDAYRRSWVHRAAERQYTLQDGLPLTGAQWIGTHNSFNSPSAGPTISHWDSNQQLSLSQQLDVDVRSLELDLHNLGGVPVVCHGEGAVGCTTEPPLSAVLPELTAWLKAHPDQVVLLYLEDQLGEDVAYAVAVKQLQDAFGTKIYRPGAPGPKGCAALPLSLTRKAVRAAGAQVVLVGKCAKGWSSLVHDWNDVHVESGSTTAYRPFPDCDATYKRDVYDAKLVRYYEDSTLVKVTIAPTTPGVDPELLTPAKTAAMSACGVGLFGFDQLLPHDGRLAATIWSWAPEEPNTDRGACAAQREDGRWASRACTQRLPAACRTVDGWTRSAPVVFAAAGAACAATSARFDPPRTGYENAQLHVLAGAAATWIDQGPPTRASVRCSVRARRARCLVHSTTGTPIRARLSHGGKTVARAAATVRRGRATVSFRPRLRRGRYVVQTTVGATTVTRRLRLR